MLKPIMNYSINSKNLMLKNSKENQSLSTTTVVEPQKQQKQLFPKSYVSFGWCTPHIGAMQSLNVKFNKAIQKVLHAQNMAKSTIEGKNIFKNTQYSLLDNASAEAATLFSQYCNAQFAMSEMLPSYALSLNKPLKHMMAESDVMSNPVNTLITINDVMKLKFKAGIDKNTGQEYTAEQIKKAKAGTQLYTTVMMVEKINENMNHSGLTAISREKIQGLTNMIHSAIDSIYGKNTYQRIKNLSEIGENPTLDQKQASINLIKEIDSKAQELILPEEFKKELQSLIDYQNGVEGKALENKGSGLKDDFTLKLSYHTHSHVKVSEQGEGITKVQQGHTHGIMSEEEHRIFHEQELKQREQEKNQQRNAGE